MPKLTPLQWLIAAVFLAFYGFAVFAVTRDYYVRHPVRASAGATQPAPTQGVAPVRNPGERADVLFGEGRYAEAIPLYRQVLAANALDWETWNDLGLATHLSGDTAQAIEILRAASAQAPEFQRLWLTLGFVNLQAGDLPAAQESLGRARDLDPEGPIGQEATRLLGVAKASANQ